MAYSYLLKTFSPEYCKTASDEFKYLYMGQASMDFRNSFIISKKRKLKYIRNIGLGGGGRGEWCKTSTASLHMMYPDLQPDSLNQLFTLVYKFPIRSTLDFNLLKKIPHILALRISYNLFKVLINNEVKMY